MTATNIARSLRSASMPDARGHRAGSPLIAAIRSWKHTGRAGLVTTFSTASSQAGPNHGRRTGSLLAIRPTCRLDLACCSGRAR